MRILVTGATGFVGSHSVRRLRSEGHELRLLVRDPAKAARVFDAGDSAPADLVVGDVTDPVAVAKALDGVDAVLHSAAVVAVEARRAHEVEETNLRAVELVVGGAVERDVSSIVYVSSLAALFSPGEGPVHADAPVAEAESAYARSKADGERFVRELQSAGAPIRTVYPPGILGPDDPGLSEGNHTLRTFLRDLMVDTSAGFETLDVRDLAAVNAALLRPEVPPGRYVAGGRYLSWREQIELLDDLTGTRVRRVSLPGSVVRACGRIGDLVKHVFPFDFPLSKEAMELATLWPGSLRSPLLEDLVGFRDVRETYRDTIRWLYEAGHLTRQQAGDVIRNQGSQAA